MSYYYKLRQSFVPKERRNHVIDRLLDLKKQLNDEIPDKDLERNLLLATWNIRDFGRKGGYGYGERLPESLFYIAEVLSSFDLIAVQEVNGLEPLETVMSILGSNYTYIATDVSDSKAGGNGERLTFVYDRRKIWFKNIAGEIVLPSSLLISKTEFETEDGKVVAGKQFRRTPYAVSFQCGWFKFDLCTVHIYFGSDSGPALQERIEEIKGIANYLGDRARKNLKDERSTILLGDFNIHNPKHETMKALTDAKFIVPENLRKPTNLGKDRFYDQIALITSKEQIDNINLIKDDSKEQDSGVFELFKSCFTDEEMEVYKPIFSGQKNSAAAIAKGEEATLKYYQTWRTWQLSDHHVLWTRLLINNSEKYLESCRI